MITRKQKSRGLKRKRKRGGGAKVGLKSDNRKRLVSCDTTKYGETETSFRVEGTAGARGYASTRGE